MKLVSINVNGIKAFCEKGGLGVLMGTLNPDLLCFQETKANRDRFGKYTDEFTPEYVRYHCENKFKKGYAGVGILLKRELLGRVIKSETPTLEDTYGSGRIIHLEFDTFHFITVYTLNSGNKDVLRQFWDGKFKELTDGMGDKPLVVMGDLNVVRSQIDYCYNLDLDRNTMPGLKDYERSGIESYLSKGKLVDSFRHLHPEQRTFSWFSYSNDSYSNNRGWRIDYSLVSENLIDKVIRSEIRDDIRYSDHVPIELEIDI